MYAFLVKKKLSIQVDNFFRVYNPVTDLSQASPSKMYIHCGREQELIVKLLEEENRDREDIVLVNEAQLLSLDLTPPRLGRMSAKLITPTLTLYNDKSPLLKQLQILKQKNPNKATFRIAILNSYGSNLGDAMMGASAMRWVSQILKKYLGGFNVDLYIGLCKDSTAADIISYEDWVANVFSFTPTVDEFSIYDAYFDFTGLLSLPRFNKMPIVDWFLWWFGLEPDEIPLEKKRNKVNIREQSLEYVRELLEPFKSKKVFLFNHESSTNLRSCPGYVAVKIIKKILEKHLSVHVVIAQELEFKHKRLLNLSQAINSVQRYIALVTEVDAVITVDTFAQHIADAASVATVALFSSIDPMFYKYYPFSENITIPDAKKLPAWGKAKLNQEEWLLVKPLYLRAWEKLNVGNVLKSLNKKMEYRKSFNECSGVKIFLENHLHDIYVQDSGVKRMRYFKDTELFKYMQIEVIKMLNKICKTNMHGCIATPGSFETIADVVKKLVNNGKLYIFEPRQVLRELMHSNLKQQGFYDNIFLQETLTFSGRQVLFVNDMDIYTEFDLMEWGNTRKKIQVKSDTVDSFELSQCDFIAILSPSDILESLKGAMNTIEKHKPNIVLGPIKYPDSILVYGVLKKENYNYFFSKRLGSSNKVMMLCISDKIGYDLDEYEEIGFK